MPARTNAAKLLIKPASTLWCLDPSRLAVIGPLPDGVRPTDVFAEADTAVAFVDDSGALDRFLADEGDRLTGPGVLWIAYPKGGRADINRDSLWPRVAALGLRPITQVALDEVWSALRFRPLRADEAQFSGGQ